MKSTIFNYLMLCMIALAVTSSYAGIFDAVDDAVSGAVGTTRNVVDDVVRPYPYQRRVVYENVDDVDGDDEGYDAEEEMYYL